MIRTVERRRSHAGWRTLYEIHGWDPAELDEQDQEADEAPTSERRRRTPSDKSENAGAKFMSTATALDLLFEDEELECEAAQPQRVAQANSLFQLGKSAHAGLTFGDTHSMSPAADDRQISQTTGDLLMTDNTCVPRQKETEFFERLMKTHAEEAGQLGIEVVGKVYEDDDVTQIVTSTTAGFLVTSLDRKTDEVEHKWLEAEPYDPWADFCPDCDDIGD